MPWLSWTPNMLWLGIDCLALLVVLVLFMLCVGLCLTACCCTALSWGVACWTCLVYVVVFMDGMCLEAMHCSWLWAITSLYGFIVGCAY